ncbi:hypothetical protein IEQ34_012346 [Dendrobium chrysotoxum]|uniref:Uncharacterized protein n=1 Tax=Dendrobium chrysotoxum TaxID=161865 RepID=A0AAV7GTR1_DENCH|nr:hypothetical protein IEQ34_012346 [Dendrobium chrysotoxum]
MPDELEYMKHKEQLSLSDSLYSLEQRHPTPKSPPGSVSGIGRQLWLLCFSLNGVYSHSIFALLLLFARYYWKSKSEKQLERIRRSLDNRIRASVAPIHSGGDATGGTTGSLNPFTYVRMSKGCSRILIPQMDKSVAKGLIPKKEKELKKREIKRVKRLNILLHVKPKLK